MDSPTSSTPFSSPKKLLSAEELSTMSKKKPERDYLESKAFKGDQLSLYNTNLNLNPSVGNGRPVLFDTHNFSHLFNARVTGHSIIVGQLILLAYSSRHTFSCYLPQHKSKSIDITSLVCIKIPHMQIVFKKLWGHVTLGTNSVAMGNINRVTHRIMANSKTQITYATCTYKK